MKRVKCVGWGQEPGRCEENIQNSSTDQVPFEGKAEETEGQFESFLVFGSEDGKFSEPITEGSYSVIAGELSCQLDMCAK